VQVGKCLRFESYSVILCIIEYSVVGSDNAQDVTTSMAHADCCQQACGCCPLSVTNVAIFQWNVDTEIKKDAMS
jgi:hypothetical protein